MSPQNGFCFVSRISQRYNRRLLLGLQLNTTHHRLQIILKYCMRSLRLLFTNRMLSDNLMFSQAHKPFFLNMQTMLLRSRSLLCTVLRFKEMFETLREQKSEYFVFYRTEKPSFQIAIWLSWISSFCAHITMIIGIKEIEK